MARTSLLDSFVALTGSATVLAFVSACPEVPMSHGTWSHTVQASASAPTLTFRQPTTPTSQGAFSERLQQNVFAYFDSLMDLEDSRIFDSAVDMDWEGQAQQVINSKKRTLDEANAPPEFAVNYAAGTHAHALLEMTNILIELPQPVQERLGAYGEQDRMVLLNAYLNCHLELLPDEDKQAVKRVVDGGNYNKFCQLKHRLFRFASMLEDI